MNRAAQLGPFGDRSTDLLLPLFFSLLLHVFFVWLFSTGGMSVSLPLGASPPLDVEILGPEQARRLAEQGREEPPSAAEEAPPPPKTQIVSPSDGPEAIPDDPRFLSERNSRAEEEMVKRGEPAPAAEPPRELARREEAPSGPAGRERPAPREEAQTEARELPGLESLFAKPSDVVDDPTIGAGRGKGRAGDERDYAAVARPELWADPGERGTPDYLPDVRQGKFTLLNAKADLFAPFVRRVGLRVFQT
ncbi:MAG: hypothetical protein ACREQY_04915, partial [Candidatus Binatia bacterium]